MAKFMVAALMLLELLSAQDPQPGDYGQYKIQYLDKPSKCVSSTSKPKTVNCKDDDDDQIWFAVDGNLCDIKKSRCLKMSGSVGKETAKMAKKAQTAMSFKWNSTKNVLEIVKPDNGDKCLTHSKKKFSIPNCTAKIFDDDDRLVVEEGKCVNFVKADKNVKAIDIDDTCDEWAYNKDTQQIENKSNPGQCLEAHEDPTKRIITGSCEKDVKGNKWTVDKHGRYHPSHSANMCIGTRNEYLALGSCGEYIKFEYVPPTCTCKNGEAVDDADCSDYDADECKSCDKGFELENGEIGDSCVKAKKPECECENGSPMKGKKCKVDGSNHCKKCDKTFTLDTSGEFNKCVSESEACACPNGSGFDPCPKPDITHCETCDPGWEVKKVGAFNVCVEEPDEDACYCDFGTPSTDPAECRKPGWHQCAKCDDGYKMFEKAGGKFKRCKVIPLCKCFKGTPVSSDNCPRHQMSLCEKCDTGYKLKGNKRGCVPEKEPELCDCPNGTPVADIDCPKKGNIECASCEDGFKRNRRNECKPLPECECKNGTPLADEDCPRDGRNKCEKCDAGYELTGRLHCKPIDTPTECVCENGDAVADKDCPEKGDDVCSSCDPGFELEGDWCVLMDACVCKNGTPVDKETCLEGGLNQCKSCDDNYELEIMGDVAHCVPVEEPTKCTCENGTAVADGDCDPAGEDCTACDTDFDLVDGKCVPIVLCRCKHGVAVGSSDCPREDKNHCASCDQGYELNDRSHCRPIKTPEDCVCENGDPVADEDCEKAGEADCSACDEDFTMVGDECVSDDAPNECRCKNGTPVESEDCARDDKNICAKCDKGYELNDRKHCRPIKEPVECICDNGDAVADEDCPKTGTHECTACDRHYDLVDGKCIDVNECVCRNGKPVKDKDCPRDGKNRCRKCNKGFQLKGKGFCVPIKEPTECVCENGDPISDEECEKDGDNECAACDDDFDLTANNDCDEPIECVCANGIPLDSADCPRDGRNKCKACDKGYELNGRLHCVPVETPVDCVCENGDAVIDEDCPKEGENVCTACDETWNLVKGECVQIEECVCRNGKPVADKDCPRDGKNRCRKCNKGYKLVGKGFCVPIKEPTKCACLNGTAVADEDCPANGDNDCTACEDDFELDANSNCVPDVACKCVGGTPVDDIDCPKDGKNVCKECDDGYKLSPKGNCKPVKPTECACENGTPVTDEDCPDGFPGTACTACDFGFELINWECPPEKPTCNCLFGTAVDDKDCPSMDDNECKSCDDNYELDDNNNCIPKVTPKKCRCSDGTPVADEDCPRKGARVCAGCNAGFELNQENRCRQIKKCACQNGTPMPSTTCPKEGKLMCLECNFGYELNNKSQCVPVKEPTLCKCENGVATGDPDCENKDDLDCTACDDDKVWDGEKCVDGKECECKNGTAVDNEDCPEADKNVCESCNDEYELTDDKECKPKVDPTKCMCDNGDAVADDDCDVTNLHDCTSCDANFELINGRCIAVAQCKCKNGTPVLDKDCPREDKNVCSKCDEGYKLTGKLDCRPIKKPTKCTCENGDAVADEDCPKDGEANCTSCDNRFELVGDECVPNIKECVCENGTPVEDADCPRDGNNKCQSCDPGFHLGTGGKCKPDKPDPKCVCRNGLPVPDEDCPGNNHNECASCDPGFELKTNGMGGCWRSRPCKCPHGTPLGPDECPRKGKHICIECDKGYVLNRRKHCKPEKPGEDCKCENGDAVADEDCPTKDDNVCAACDEDFDLNDDNECVDDGNQCLCAHGDPVEDVDCPKEDKNVCAKCDDGYRLTEKKNCKPIKPGTKCTCKDGFPVADEDCPKKGKPKCAACIDGFELIGKKCVKIEGCECDNGEPADNCDTDGEQKCKDCDPGFELNDEDTCDRNECKCENGTAAVAPHCTTDGADICEKCNEGFELNDDKTECTKIPEVPVCKCENGTPLVAPECKTDGADACEKCNEGFELNADKTECNKPKVCKCDDGTPVDGADCPTAGANKCKECNDNFHLEGDDCKKDPKCKCKNGDAAVWPECDTDGAKICATCKDDHHLTEDDQCEEDPTCKCKNGDAAVWPECDTDGAKICASCKDDHHLTEDDKCEEDPTCKCKNGTAAVWPECDTDGEKKCASCDDDLQLDDEGKCVKNPECVCENGTPAAAEKCTTDGAAICEKCNAGFELNDDKTECTKIPVCKCDNGTPAVAPDCDKDGANKCEKCNDGHHLTVTNVCIKTPVCKCENGTPNVHPKCPIDGANNCEKCDDTFQLNDSTGECEKIPECKCDDGTPVDSADCPADGDNMCKSCKDTHYIDDNGQCILKPRPTSECHGGASCGGDVHCSSFDGRTVDFHGNCTYRLTGLCDSDDATVSNPDFELTGTNHKREETDDVTLQKANDLIYTTTGGDVVHFRINVKENNQWPEVSVNGGNFVDVQTNHHYSFGLYVTGDSTNMKAYFGLDSDFRRADPNKYAKIKFTFQVVNCWYWKQYLNSQIFLGCGYKDKLCGIMGNFNDKADDDWQNPQGENMPYVAGESNSIDKAAYVPAMNFGNTWLTNGDFCASDEIAKNAEICSKEDFAKYGTEEYCGKLKNEKNFGKCTKDIEKAVFECQYDLCAAKGVDADEQMCDILSTREQTCIAEGEPVGTWRSVDSCPGKCANDKMVFKDDALGCAKTVFNCNSNLGCNLPPGPGCECPDDAPILNGQECVAKCPPQNMKVHEPEGQCFGTASGWGDTHYSSFDGFKSDFHGNCSYVLTESNSDDLPSIKIVGRQAAENDDAKTTFLQGYTVNYNDRDMPISCGFDNKKGDVKGETWCKTGKKAKALSKFKSEDLLEYGIIVKDEFVYFGRRLNDAFKNEPTKNFFLKLKFKGDTLSVCLECSYKGKVNGYLGNFNGHIEDDFTTKGGVRLSTKQDEARESPHNLDLWSKTFYYGASWNAGKENCALDEENAKVPIYERPETKETAIKYCNKFAQTPMKICGISTEQRVKNCIFDLTHTNVADWGKKLCDMFTGYKGTCDDKGKDTSDWEIEECDEDFELEFESNIAKGKKLETINIIEQYKMSFEIFTLKTENIAARRNIIQIGNSEFSQHGAVFYKAGTTNVLEVQTGECNGANKGDVYGPINIVTGWGVNQKHTVRVETLKDGEDGTMDIWIDNIHKGQFAVKLCDSKAETPLYIGGPSFTAAEGVIQNIVYVDNSPDPTTQIQKIKQNVPWVGGKVKMSSQFILNYKLKFWSEGNKWSQRNIIHVGTTNQQRAPLMSIAFGAGLEGIQVMTSNCKQKQSGIFNRDYGLKMEEWYDLEIKVTHPEGGDTEDGKGEFRINGKLKGEFIAFYCPDWDDTMSYIWLSNPWVGEADASVTGVKWTNL